MKHIFVYDHSELTDGSFNLYALSSNHQSVCVNVKGFMPHIYIELQSEFVDLIEGSDNDDDSGGDDSGGGGGNIVGNVRQCAKILKIPIFVDIEMKKKLFYNHKTVSPIDGSLEETLFPYLKVRVKSTMHMYMLCKRLRTLHETLKIHENNVPSFLKLMTRQNLQSTGWIGFTGQLVTFKKTNCQYEYTCAFDQLVPPSETRNALLVQPTVLCYDIEVYSDNINVFPLATNPANAIFQISVVVIRPYRSGKTYEKHLLTLGGPFNIDGVAIMHYECETDLILGFKNSIQTINPNIITGYNITGFDEGYIIDRATHLGVLPQYLQSGMICNKRCRVSEIQWTSSAMSDRSFRYVDRDGRIVIDVMEIVKRDYKLDNYKLSTVGKTIVNNDKTDLSVKGIFKAYETYLNHRGTQIALDAMTECGVYCVQDSVLVCEIFDKIQCWIGLTEMAGVCCVTVKDLVTRGQQLKVFSQVYSLCCKENTVVERDGYSASDSDQYEGAYVVAPIPGVYNNVVPFDFASLYPTTMIAYNICYSTLVTDDSIPDELCHVIEWTETQTLPPPPPHHHLSESKTSDITPVYFLTTPPLPLSPLQCPDHEKSCNVSQPPKKFLFRFLKSPPGILPRLLQYLLDARRNTRREMKKISDSDTLAILDKRQLAYKISSNSVYGSLGVRMGYLPFLPGAMCTTAMGRHNIRVAQHHIQTEYSGELVYGDTDSCYIHFPNVPLKELWNHCLHVENNMRKLFPAPIELLFEEAIYSRFLILTKKRYMAIKVNEALVEAPKLLSKGVVLTRRDNAGCIRQLYEELVTAIMRETLTRDDVPHYVVELLNKVCSHAYPIEMYTVTKKIGSNYVIRDLPIEPLKRTKRLLSLAIHRECSCTDLNSFQCATCIDYISKTRPAHIILAHKMRTRGLNIDVGERITYCVVQNGDLQALRDKLEDPCYVSEFSEFIKLDMLYYIKLMSNIVDECLFIGYGHKDFVKTQYKIRLAKHRCCCELVEAFSSVFVM